jgi:predicted ATPase
MDQIKIRNLRSLKDTGFINLKPLTILVGKNSSGKSTLLRFFPLMKQTLSTKKNEPILWYSKEVDFGSFEESINRNSKEKIIGFDFNFRINGRYRGEEKPIPLSLSVDLKEKSVQRINIQIYDNEILFKEENNYYKLFLNNQEVESSFNVYGPNVFETFLPRFFINTKNYEKDSLIRNTSVTEYFKEALFNYVLTKLERKNEIEYQSKLKKDIKLFVQELTFRNLELLVQKDRGLIEKIEREIQTHTQISLFDDIDFISEYHEEASERESNYIGTNTNEILNFLRTVDEEEYINIKNLFLGLYVSKLIDICNDYLNSYFSQVHYIAPLRASAQRYYRIQGLAVDEIDPQGENIPMAINHLSHKDKVRFKNWMNSNFGFEIDTKVKGGHATLNISFDNSESLNLADTGFGFSQILPILLLLWRVENNYFSLRTSRWGRHQHLNIHNIVIEQPELHLHPALQARLTDALVKCIEKANEKGITLNIIIETHSETIINRVGKLIYKEQIEKNKINVLILGDLENHNPSESCITSVSFDKEGIIENWPLGFFYPEV